MSMILPYLLPGIISTMAAIGLLFRPAVCLGLLDRPGGRKQHQGDIPLIGGIGIFIGFWITLLVTATPLSPLIGLALGGGLLLLTGVLDDRLDLSAAVRLVLQASAALLMISPGEVSLNSLGPLFSDQALDLGKWSVFFTIFCVLGTINAVNMADGLDGLAGGLCLVALAGVTLFGYRAMDMPCLAVVMSMIACLLGFLVFNLGLFGCRRVFLGDAGSMLLGFMLSWLLIRESQGDSRIMEPVSAIWLLALPLCDTVAAMLRRMIKGRSPFSADREHFHHVLLAAGYSPRQASGLIVCSAAILAGFGSVLASWEVASSLQLLLFLVFFASYCFAMSKAWQIKKSLTRLRRGNENDT